MFDYSHHCCFLLSVGAVLLTTWLSGLFFESPFPVGGKEATVPGSEGAKRAVLAVSWMEDARQNHKLDDGDVLQPSHLLMKNWSCRQQESEETE